LKWEQLPQATSCRTDWGWPKKINRPQIQNLFRLRFIEDKANATFIANVGLGKSHLSIALGYTACLRGYSVLFTTAVDVINSLSAAWQPEARTAQVSPAATAHR
jgi:DNA replication protein DnaC